MAERRFTGLPAPLGEEVMGMNRPLVERREQDLEDMVRAAIQDETNAGDEYEEIASLADSLGRRRVARVFRNAAADERRHRREFIDLATDLGFGTPSEY